jgi:hypothetical protein
MPKKIDKWCVYIYIRLLDDDAVECLCDESLYRRKRFRIRFYVYRHFNLKTALTLGKFTIVLLRPASNVFFFSL